MNKKPIRSYVRREGRITKRQADALAYYQDYQFHCVDGCNRQSLAQQCASDVYVLEIGFGMGHSLAHMCTHYPQLGFVGVEVLAKGVGNLIHQAQTHALTNLLIHHGDIVSLLTHVDDATFDRVQIFFPDPWHKKRHNKRRLIAPAFIREIARIMTAGGIVHIKTDWQEYALAVASYFSECVLFIAPPDTHPLLLDVPETKFELRGKRLGHGVYEHIFMRNTKDV